MHIRKMLALAVSAALVLSVALTGCGGSGTPDESEAIETVLSEQIHNDDNNISISDTQWLDGCLLRAVNGNVTRKEVEDALTASLHCPSNLGAMLNSDRAFSVIRLSGTLTADEAIQKALKKWEGQIDGIPVCTADLSVKKANGYYYAVLYTVKGEEDLSTEPTPPSEDTIPENGYYIGDYGVFYVYTEEGLRAWAQAARTNGSISCTLEADIILTGNWTPVGTDSHPFIGVFKGQGHTITGLKVLADTQTYAGLFGRIEAPGEVRNLTLDNVSVHGEIYAGGIVGYNDNGNIRNCHVTSGDVDAINQSSGWFGSNADAYAGGLVGFNANYFDRVHGSVSGDVFVEAQSDHGTECSGHLIGYDTRKESPVDSFAD